MRYIEFQDSSQISHPLASVDVTGIIGTKWLWARDAHAITSGELSRSCLSRHSPGFLKIGKNVALKSPALSMQSGESSKIIGRLTILARAKTCTFRRPLFRGQSWSQWFWSFSKVDLPIPRFVIKYGNNFVAESLTQVLYLYVHIIFSYKNRTTSFFGWLFGKANNLWN